MSLTSAIQTTEYQQALEATRWEDQGIGFTEKGSAIGISALSRQLNTILYIQIRTQQEVASLKAQIKQLARPASASGTADFSDELEKITTQLSKLTLGKTPELPKSKAKVFVDPYELLKTIR